jgi:hypothetical protein
MNANIGWCTKHGYRQSVVATGQVPLFHPSEQAVKFEEEKTNIASLSGLLHENLVSLGHGCSSSQKGSEEMSDVIHILL